MFYIIFLFYLLMLLAVAIAKDCSGGFRRVVSLMR